MRPLLAVLSLAALSGCVASRPAAVTFATASDPVALAAWQGGVAVARQSGVEVARRGASVAVTGLAGRPLALAAAPARAVRAAALYVGTTAGLFSVDASGAATPVALPASAGALAVTALAVGQDGRLWVGTDLGGALVRDAAGAWTQALGVIPVTALAVGTDGTVWVGSQVGLFRSAPEGRWVTYAEEGTVGASIPDNVVDGLAVGTGGAVWVSSPTATAVVEGDEAHAREFAFLGRRGGTLLDAAPLGAGMLLATSSGAMWLPALAPEQDGGLREIFSDPDTGALALDADALGTPPALRGDAPSRLLAAPGGTVWLASRRGVWPLRRAPR